jgi:hypothetical protein
MLPKLIPLTVAACVATLLLSANALAWGGGSWSHSGSGSYGGGSWNRSGSTSYTGRGGNTYTRTMRLRFPYFEVRPKGCRVPNE